MADDARLSGQTGARGEHARGGGLLTKFLAILTPVFLILIVPGTWMMVSYHTRDEGEELAARLGNKAAHVAGALARHAAAGGPNLARDLIAPLAAERAFLCAEFHGGPDNGTIAALPAGLGCAGRADGHTLILPVREADGSTLLVRFTDADIHEAEHRELLHWIMVVAASFVLALAAATAGFRFIISRPLRVLVDAIEASAETGKKVPVAVGGGDELAQVMAAFNDMVDRETRREAALTEAYDRLQASEAELKRLNDELEYRVRERTADLEMEKVRAESASLAKSRFLASMSHELRTPLNSIIGFAEIMKTEALGDLGDPRYLEFSEDILGSGRHLLQIIGDILDISKIEAGTMSLHEEEVDAAEIVGETLRLVQPMCDAADVDLRRTAKPPKLKLHVDPTKIKQVLINLLTNAIKFTPRGGTVDLTLALTPEGRAEFEVADTGIGMREEDIPIALSAFGQVDASKDGTGLGLALAKRLIELHGGGLDIASEPRKGTRVTVSLPRERVRAASAEVA